MAARKPKPATPEVAFASPEEAILHQILKTMEAQEAQQRLELQALTLGIENFHTELGRINLEIAEIKRAAREGQEAVQQKLEEMLRKVKLSPEDAERVVEAGIQEAQKAIETKAARFREALRDMPTGTVTSTEPQPVTLIINGVPWVIRPGENRRVPQTFIEAWEQRDEIRARAAAFEEVFHNKGDANQLGMALGTGPVWDVNLGRVS